MKSIKEFLLESAKKSNSISFDFSSLENAKETIDSLANMDYCEVDENTVTVSIDEDNYDKLDSVQDILQSFYNTVYNSSKRTNDEKYAQLVKTFGKKVEELNDKIDSYNTDEDEDEQRVHACKCLLKDIKLY